MPKVSVIIPCYNQGMFLDEAVESVLAQTFEDFEIIIVNDGSTDEQTIQQCNSYNHPKIRLVTTANQGLAAARNNGIAETEGIYILPLDADDKIGKYYLEKAVPVLDNESGIGIVYSRAILFGAVETDWPLPKYSLDEMLKNNIIFCTALYRKSDWELVGGYDPGMIYGWEDYDFWLSLIERQRRVLQLPGTHFFYRVDPNSMVRSKDRWQKIAMFKRIYQRHSSFIGNNVEIWLNAILEHNEPVIISRLYVNEGEGISDKSSISQEINNDTKIAVFNIEGFKNRKEIRFDPVDCPVCLEIYSIEIFEEKSNYKLDLSNVTSNAFSRINNLFMFESDDPQIYFPLNKEQIQNTTQINIVFDIKSLKEMALRDIIKVVTANNH